MGLFSSGAGGGLSRATKTLTNTQVKALAHPTPVTILAAPGAGFAVVPVSAFARLTWVADYTNIDNSASISVSIGTSSGLGIVAQSAGGVAGLLANGEASSAILPPVGTISGGLFVASSGYIDGDIENQAISISATNAAAGDFTGGNAGNSLKITLLYYVVTF